MQARRKSETLAKKQPAAVDGQFLLVAEYGGGSGSAYLYAPRASILNVKVPESLTPLVPKSRILLFYLLAHATASAERVT